MSRLGWWWVFLIALVLGGCAKNAQMNAPSSPPPATPAAGGDAYEAASAPPESEVSAGSYGPSADAPAPAARSAPGGGAMQQSESKASDRAYEQPSTVRPGLGTAWGENVASPTRTAPFVRESTTPFALASVWYNDREGANAMSRAADYRAYDNGSVPVLGGALTVSLRTPDGRRLPSFMAGGKQFAVGEADQRYIIVIRNNTSFRYEVVASVDGLDVIDGTAASFDKRGYLLQPHDTLEIEGFRRSADQVAAFRFSSVRGSYAARSGQGDRNVGVIGVAFFHEEGTNPRWTPEEIQRRHGADPFPGRYAVPPSN